jgi:hypothetical protein
MDNEKVTERFKNLICSESEKNALHAYLFSSLVKGKSYRLKRNRVLIMEKEDNNKFIILQVVGTKDGNRIFLCFGIFIFPLKVIGTILV